MKSFTLLQLVWELFDRNVVKTRGATCDSTRDVRRGVTCGVTSSEHIVDTVTGTTLDVHLHFSERIVGYFDGSTNLFQSQLQSILETKLDEKNYRIEL